MSAALSTRAGLAGRSAPRGALCAQQQRPAGRGRLLCVRAGSESQQQSQSGGSSSNNTFVAAAKEFLKFEKNFLSKAGEALKATVVPQVYDPEKEEFEVDALIGLRAMVDEETGRKFVEYLVRWKDGSPCTWEDGRNISEDVLRDYEQQWWTSAREGDLGTMTEMLKGGKRLLANTIDENGRSALHFTAAIGNSDCTQLLIDGGADVNVSDKDGYTPLHMAAGYLHTSTVITLLEAGADSEQEDVQGRCPMTLIESLRANMPAGVPQLLQRRAGLEAVARVMVDSLYEDVEPVAILEERVAEKGVGREYLVRWPVDEEGERAPDSWVPAKDLAEDILEDWRNQLEWATAAEILDKRRVEGNVQYLVRWQDDYENLFLIRRRSRFALSAPPPQSTGSAYLRQHRLQEGLVGAGAKHPGDVDPRVRGRAGPRQGGAARGEEGGGGGKWVARGSRHMNEAKLRDGAQQEVMVGRGGAAL